MLTPTFIFLLWFNVLIFITLALIHYYWATGGTWAFDAALPRDQEGKRLLNPGKIDSFIVGTGLLIMGGYLSIWGANISIDLSPTLGWIWDNAVWGMIAIFTLRAIGEFQYVGFFKKFKASRFAYLDSRLYSPLCLWLGLSLLYLSYLR